MFELQIFTVFFYMFVYICIYMSVSNEEPMKGWSEVDTDTVQT